MTELPVACTLTATAAEERAQEFRELAARALIGRTRNGLELELRFAALEGVPAQVESLAARERECCAFLSIDVENSGDEVTLRLTAPEGAGETLDLFASSAA